MRELAKSFFRFSWAMSLFGIEQMGNVMFLCMTVTQVLLPVYLSLLMVRKLMIEVKNHISVLMVDMLLREYC